MKVIEITPAEVTRITVWVMPQDMGPPTGTFVRFDKCHMKQKVADLSSRYSATINVVTISCVTKFTIDNQFI